MFCDSWQSSVASVFLSFSRGKIIFNYIRDPIISLATLILRSLKFKGGLIKNYDLFANC